MAKASSHFLDAVESASLSITGTISIEFWLKLDSLPSASSNMTCVAKDDTAGSRGYVVFVNSANDTLYFFASSDGTTNNFIQKKTDAALATGEWHHWAITYNPSTATVVIYKDGSSVAITDASVGSVSAIYDTNTKTNVGANTSGAGNTWYMDGKMDEARIWNDIRTATEISDNYQIELTGSEGNLVAYWPFEALGGGGGGGASGYMTTNSKFWG